MTHKKDLKKRVRARQAETGQRYTEALRDVRGEGEAAPAPVPLAPVRKRPDVKMIEMPEVTPLAESCGLRCRVYLTPDLWSGQAPGTSSDALTRRALERLRDIAAGGSELGLLPFRRAVLEGKAPEAVIARDQRNPLGNFFEFTRRTSLGLRGPSLDGRYLAFDLELPGGGSQTLTANLMMSVPGSFSARIFDAPPGAGDRAVLILARWDLEKSKRLVGMLGN